MYCDLLEIEQSLALQTLRSIPRSITWQPLRLFMFRLQEQSSVQKVCAALGGTPLAQAAAGLTLKIEL